MAPQRHTELTKQPPLLVPGRNRKALEAFDLTTRHLHFPIEVEQGLLWIRIAAPQII